MPPEVQKAIEETGHSGPEGAPQEMPTGSYQGLSDLTLCYCGKVSISHFSRAMYN